EHLPGYATDGPDDTITRRLAYLVEECRKLLVGILHLALHGIRNGFLGLIRCPHQELRILNAEVVELRRDLGHIVAGERATTHIAAVRVECLCLTARYELQRQTH